MGCCASAAVDPGAKDDAEDPLPTRVAPPAPPAPAPAASAAAGPAAADSTTSSAVLAAPPAMKRLDTVEALEAQIAAEQTARLQRESARAAGAHAARRVAAAVHVAWRAAAAPAEQDHAGEAAAAQFRGHFQRLLAGAEAADAGADGVEAAHSEVFSEPCGDRAGRRRRAAREPPTRDRENSSSSPDSTSTASRPTGRSLDWWTGSQLSTSTIS